eukprot:4068665-Pleurochrysis_carterae.AAC.1
MRRTLSAPLVVPWRFMTPLAVEAIGALGVIDAFCKSSDRALRVWGSMAASQTEDWTHRARPCASR